MEYYSIWMCFVPGQPSLQGHARSKKETTSVEGARCGTGHNHGKPGHGHQWHDRVSKLGQGHQWHDRVSKTRSRSYLVQGRR